MKNLLIIIVQILFFLSSHAQTSIGNQIVGEYSRTDGTFNAGMHSRLSLYDNGRYKYETGTHMQVYHSYGIWKLKGDTVVLNSTIDAENIPITIKEKRVDSLKNRLTFDLVKNLDNDIMGALLYFNEDTMSACDPLTSSGCDKKVGSVNSVKVEFTKDASTKWYKIKNKKANFIEITVGVHDLLALYIFTKNERYLYKDGTLQYIPKDNTTKGEILKK